MKNIKSIIFNSESFKFDDSNYAKLDEVNNFQKAITVTDTTQIITVNPYLDAFENPSGDLQQWIFVGEDANNVPVFKWKYYKDTDGRSRVALSDVRYNSNDITDYDMSGIEIGHDKDGNFFTSTVTPPENASNNYIANALWCRMNFAGLKTENHFSARNYFKSVRIKTDEDDTYNACLRLSSNKLIKGQAQTDNFQEEGIIFTDKNELPLGEVASGINNSGVHYVFLRTRNPIEDNYSQIRLEYDLNGKCKCTAPNTNESPSSNEIITASYIYDHCFLKDRANEYDGYLVDKTLQGDATRTYILNKTNFIKGQNPETSIACAYKLVSPEGSGLNETFAESLLCLENDGSTLAWLNVYKNVDGDATSENISIKYDKPSDSYVTHAPTPKDDANSTEIATCQWVLNLLKSKGLIEN